MVGNMIRVLRARMTLLAVDEAGMSTVEYSTIALYNRHAMRCSAVTSLTTPETTIKQVFRTSGV